jgi:LAS superfamily LD-carboxypeptidase LdcB
VLNADKPLVLSHPELFGLDESALVPCQTARLEKDTAVAFMAMADAAKADGIELAICSGFRSFSQQLAIWNAKAGGKRVLLDRQSQPVDIQGLDDDKLIDIILLWSALPGTSRHHWGTDLDLYDASAISRDALRLVEAEYAAEGPCGKLHAWLERHGAQFGFFFPYRVGLSGVSPEPWHLSYAPAAAPKLAQFENNRTELRRLIDHSDMRLKFAVLSRLDALVADYVLRIAPSAPDLPR